MLFVAICLDKPGSLETRLSTRAAHLTFLEQNARQVKLGGPFLDADEKPVGSMLILDCDNESLAQALLERDPYAMAGLFKSVELRPWKRVVGAEI